ncbi:hypothetical protein ACVW0P_000945 [Mucilaginibacter sp. UYNi724]
MKFSSGGVDNQRGKIKKPASLKGAKQSLEED